MCQQVLVLPHSTHNYNMPEITHLQTILFCITGAVAARNAVFDQGSGLILMSNLHCSGMESTILACDQYPDNYGVLSCSHLQDASIICEGT